MNRQSDTGSGGYEYLDSLFTIYGKPMVNSRYSRRAKQGMNAKFGEEAEAVYSDLGTCDEEYGSTDDEAGVGPRESWRGSSVSSDEGPQLNLEWVSMAVGCGPVRRSDLSDAFAQVGMQQRDVPMYLADGGNRRAKRKVCSLDEEEALYIMPKTKKPMLNSGGASPGTSALFGRLLEDIEHRMDLDVPTAWI